MKTRLVVPLVGLAIGFALPTFAQEKESAPSASAPVATPTPTLGENYTQVLPDQRVTFRLLAPKANAVKVVIGVNSGVDEPQGPTFTDMTKRAVPIAGKRCAHFLKTTRLVYARGVSR
jgi:hypothetical protein